MAVEKDQSAWLPEPPPPRPARRDAAMDAALRRFDGIDEPAPATRERRSWTRTHRPQMAVMISALLLMIVGIPAALIGLRNAPSPPERNPAPATSRESGCAGKNCPSEPAPSAQRAPALRDEPTETRPPIPSAAVSPPVPQPAAGTHV